MKTYMKPFFVSVLLAVAIWFGFFQWRNKASHSEESSQLQEMDRMESQGLPELVGKDIYGKAFSLHALKGKVIILNFWASWCGPCVEEVPSMLELVQAFKGRVHLVAVSGDSSLGDVEAFLKAFPAMKQSNVTVIWDEHQEFAKTYAVDRLPESFIAGPDLKLVKKIVGSIHWHSKESEAYIERIFEGTK